jgi:2,3-bisphosphoglycerate-independent phosphoglycerate mutase
VATYDLQPEMSAFEVTQKILQDLGSGRPDFICLNLANPDMVGHTGVFNAIVKAVETVDCCLQKIINTGLKEGYSFIVISDHGNADLAINKDGSPHTAHSLNPVPVIFVSQEINNKIKNGVLGDIAPTILKLFGIKKPDEMTGEALIQK